MEARCKAEVEALHRFFEEWLSGRRPDTDEDWRRFPDVLAEDFHLVSPDGVLLDRQGVLDGLRGAHGGCGDDLRIWTENAAGRRVAGTVWLVTYEEWQERDGETLGRLSTALFRAAADAPNGVQWLHVHETWLPEGRRGRTQPTSLNPA